MGLIPLVPLFPLAAGVILRQFPLPGHPLTREDSVSLVVATVDGAP